MNSDKNDAIKYPCFRVHCLRLYCMKLLQPHHYQSSDLSNDLAGPTLVCNFKTVDTNLTHRSHGYRGGSDCILRYDVLPFSALKTAKNGTGMTPEIPWVPFLKFLTHRRPRCVLESRGPRTSWTPNPGTRITGHKSPKSQNRPNRAKIQENRVRPALPGGKIEFPIRWDH